MKRPHFGGAFFLIMLLPFLLILVAITSIQTGAGLAKGLFPLAGVAGTSTFRLLFASLILWAIWRPWRFKLTIQDLKNLFIFGLSLGFMNLTFYFAIERIPLGPAVTLEFIGPLGVSLLSSRKKLDFLWVTFAALGIFLVMPQDQARLATDGLGILFALIAGFFWALYIYFGKRAGTNLHAGLATTMGMTFAFLVVLPFGLLLDGEKLSDPNLLPMGIVVAIFSSALPYSLEMYSLKRIPAKTFGILMSLEPVAASLIGLFFLNQELSHLQWGAILCVIVASLGTTLTN